MSETLSYAIEGGFRVSYEERVKTSTSSKGNQIKWRRADGIWAKADNLGYEGLAEQTASKLLACSNVDGYAKYLTCQIWEDGVVQSGCVSADFLEDGEELITLARLFEADVLRYDKDMENMSARRRLEYLIENTERITGMTGFGRWLGMLLEFDALVLNEDRHLHNIAVVRKPDGVYRPMPLFDHGAAFLSDTTRDYPVGIDTSLLRMISRVKSKPIATDFDKQLAAVSDVLDLSLKLNSTPEQMWVSSEHYPETVVTRVRNIVRHQAMRYPHLFFVAPHLCP